MHTRCFVLVGCCLVASFAAPSRAQVTKLDVKTEKLAHDKVLRVKDEKPFVFKGEFMIDADGAPTAYHPGYTCEGAYQKRWKRSTKIDCSARSTKSCRIRGFKDDPAPGAEGDLVRCGTVKEHGKWVCTETSHHREIQGGCTQNSTANSGLDYLANAGYPGHFYGIVTDGKDGTGEPFVQGPNDPAPGYYVSATALANAAYPEKSPLRWVDSTKINYVALPKGAMTHLGAQKGDYVVAINWRTGKQVGAIFADVGSDYDDDLGEGSIALAAALGITGTPKGGGEEEHVVYVVFPGTTKGFPTDERTVEQNALTEFFKWGGPIKLFNMIPKEWVDSYKKD